jgi:alpha-L-arabinofuranosidase
VDVIQPLLKAAAIGLLRYGGGSYADYYDWQTNTDIQTCIWGNPFGSFTGAPFPYDTTAPFTGASCDSTDSLPFDQFAAQAKAIGAQSLVTVNYGSGTPAEAAAWVSHARTSGDGVALWEVGNENYGC